MAELGSPIIVPTDDPNKEKIPDGTNDNGDHPDANKEVIVSVDDLNKLIAIIQAQIDAIGSKVSDTHASVQDAHAAIATLAASAAPTNAPEAPKASTPSKPKK